MSVVNILTGFFIILLFPVAFILHDAEEVIVQHRWMLAHRSALSNKFPRMKKMINHLCGLSTKAFAVAALEESVIIILVTYLSLAGKYSYIIDVVWLALFMAFSFHLVIHIIQGIIVRGYVPGFATSLLLLPFYSFVGMRHFCNYLSISVIAVTGLTGIVIMVVNLIFAHWLGKKIFPN